VTGPPEDCSTDTFIQIDYDHARIGDTFIRIADAGKDLGLDEPLSHPGLVLDWGNGALCLEGAAEDLLAFAHRLWAATATVVMPWARHQFLITVAGADPNTETIVRHLTADLTAQADSQAPLRITVHRQDAPSAPE
jgi:hypothetical protein